VLTLSEAAARLGLAASTLRHQVQAGRLRATPVGKTYVITEDEIARYRAEHLGKIGRPSHRAAPRSGR
jgi:excisionase family DNA binding protein